MRAPEFFGAVCCVLLALGTLSCKKRSSTPDWDTAEGSTSAVVDVSLPTGVSPKVDGGPKAVEPNAEPGSTDARPTAGLRFISYNVKNWLTMDRNVDRKPLKNSSKPEAGKAAVVRILVDHSPDVVGICEIGEVGDLGEIQEMLKEAGLNLPYLHFTGGSDPVRRLGILSRYPITSTAKPVESDFQLRGKPFSINRGILDATIQAHGKPYRFLGVHLKSKREVDYADQEQMRIHEARLLRRHVDAIRMRAWSFMAISTTLGRVARSKR